MAERNQYSEVVIDLADEFVRRCQHGERPPLSEYTDKYPQHAAEILELFPAMAMIEDVAMADTSDGVLLGSRPRDVGFSSGTMIADYRITREIGRGGMGIVYEAVQISLGRRVALKVLPRPLLLDEKHTSRFDREAKSASQLHHTNIVPVFAVGQQDGTRFYAMQFIDGAGLDEVIEEVRQQWPPSSRHHRPIGSADTLNRHVACGSAEGRDKIDCDDGRSAVVASRGGAGKSSSVGASQGKRKGAPGSSSSFSTSITHPESGNSKDAFWRSVADIGVQVADALSYAHGQGVLHRDIKPSNLILDGAGRIWLTDFGLAKRDDEKALTQTGDIVGTLRYMSPEMFVGKADPRSDVYSLGLTLYEAAGLRSAFEGSDRRALIELVARGEPAQLDRFCPEVPADLATIIHKAIERDPDRRYQIASELGDDLQRFLSGEPIRARRASPAYRLRRWCQRNPRVAVLTSIIAALLVVITIVSSVAAIGFEKMAGNYRQLLYLSDMDLALNEHRFNLRQVRALLDRHVPGDLQEDLRGFEWYYLWKKCHRGESARVLPHRDVGCLAVSPCGKYVATGAAARGRDDVKVWNVATHALLQTFKGHTSGIIEVAFSPDSATLASASADHTVRLWNRESGQCISEFQHSDEVFSTTFLSDDLLAAGDKSGNLIVWDLKTEAPKNSLRYDSEIYSLAYSADRRLLAAGFRTFVRLWKADAIDDEHVLQELPGTSGRPVYSVAFTPDGSSILAGGWDRTIRQWDVESGEEVHRFSADTSGLAHEDDVKGIALSGDGRFLVSASEDNTVRIWDLQSKELVETLIGHNDIVYFARYTRDGRNIISVSRDDTVKVWSLPPEPVREAFGAHARAAWSLAISPSGKLMATASEDKTLKIWVVSDGRLYRQLDEHDHATRGVSFSRDSKFLAYGSGDSVRIIEVESGQETVLSFDHGAKVHDVAFSPTGDLVASAGEDGKIKLWNPHTGFSLGMFDRHAASVTSIDFSPDGSLIASATSRGAVRVWNVETKTQVAPTIEGHTQTVHTVRFSKDSKFIATACRDGTVGLWSVDDGHRMGELTAHSGVVYSLAFSPDGKLLASGSYDRTIKLWNAQTGQLRVTLQGNPESVAALDFSPDSRTLASSCYNGDVRIWRAASPDEVQRATDKDSGN